MCHPGFTAVNDVVVRATAPSLPGSSQSLYYKLLTAAGQVARVAAWTDSYRGVRPTAECHRWVFTTPLLPVVQHGTFWSVFSNSASCHAWFFQLDLLPVVVLPVSVAVLLIWLQSVGFMTVLYEPWETALLVWIILSLSPLITANICFVFITASSQIFREEVTNNAAYPECMVSCCVNFLLILGKQILSGTSVARKMTCGALMLSWVLGKCMTSWSQPHICDCRWNQIPLTLSPLREQPKPSCVKAQARLWQCYLISYPAFSSPHFPCGLLQTASLTTWSGVQPAGQSTVRAWSIFGKKYTRCLISAEIMEYP